MLLKVLVLVIFIVLWVMFIIISVTSFMGSSFTGGSRLSVGGGIGLGRTPLVHPKKVASSRLGSPLLHFFSVSSILHLVVLEYLLIRPGLMKNSERPGFPTSAALGKGIPALRNSMRKLECGYHFYQRSPCPG